MSPQKIKVLLHYHYSPIDYDWDGAANWEDCRNSLLAEQLIEKSCNGKTAWQLGERGRVFVHALINLPLPAQKWVMP